MRSRLTFASVSAALVAVLGCGADTRSPSEPSSIVGGPDGAVGAAASVPLDFEQVSAGAFHSCGVATDGKAWCWGSNDKGQLGTGTVTPSAGSAVPVAVAGGLLFRHVSAGYEHTCGLTTDDIVYCWGFNYWGQLGDGTMGEDHATRGAPAAVAGSRRFRLVRAGWSHTCAITTSADAYCWGENLYGQAGDGGTALGRPRPVAVLGGLKWRQLAGGAEHTCGVSKTDKLYCWDSTITPSSATARRRTASRRSWSPAVARTGRWTRGPTPAAPSPRETWPSAGDSTIKGRSATVPRPCGSSPAPSRATTSSIT